MVMKVVPYYDFFRPKGGTVLLGFKKINTATNPYQKLFDLDPCPGALRYARAADSRISDGHPEKKDENPEGEASNNAVSERVQVLGEEDQLDATLAELQRELEALMSQQFFS